jgi:hypothetical protein
MARGRYHPELASEFALRLAATGLGLSEFGKRAGFSRGAIYHLSRGQAPSSEEQGEKLAKAFELLNKARS